MHTPLDTIQPKPSSPSQPHNEASPIQQLEVATPPSSASPSKSSSHNLVVFLVFSLLTPLLGYYTLLYILFYYLFSLITRRVPLSLPNKSQQIFLLIAQLLLLGTLLNFVYANWFTFYPGLTYPGSIIITLIFLLLAFLFSKHSWYLRGISLASILLLVYVLAVIITPPTLDALLNSPEPSPTHLLLAFLAVLGTSLPLSLPTRSYPFIFPLFIVLSSFSLTSVKPQDFHQLLIPLLGDLTTPFYLLILTILTLTTLPRLIPTKKPPYPLLIGAILISIFLPYTAILYITAFLGVIVGVNILQQFSAQSDPRK